MESLMCRQYTFFRPPLPRDELKFHHNKFPPLPPLRELHQQQEQVCAAIACDIDHTLINQALSVQDLRCPGKWPEQLPQLPTNMLNTASVKTYSTELHTYIQRCAKRLRVIWWSTHELGQEVKWVAEDPFDQVMKVAEHIKCKQAVLVGPPVRLMTLMLPATSSIATAVCWSAS